MERSLKPLRVSPLIKAARWTFLLCGIIYGSSRLKTLLAFEKTDYIKRQQYLKEKHARIVAEDKRKTAEEIHDLGLQFEVTEFPPGWEDDL